ncbi:MAG: hypothetical protein MR439_01230 [Clostridium sp.]|nr:hypothetical protein [Clostridium sp.]
MDKKKKIVGVLITLTIIFTVMGSTFAYLSWSSSEEQKTQVTFTKEAGFSCSVNGGGNIAEGDVILMPTVVNDSTTSYYIKRTITVNPTITDSLLPVYMDLWLDINSLGTGLSNSLNLKYALTTSSTSPTTGVVSSGNFNGKITGDKVNLLTSKEYTATTTDTYYLWIWLDAAETSSDTMNQSFSLSLGGNCMNNVPASKPDIKDGMIPVVISSNGITSTVSENDASWYNYNNQEWANMVLVSDSSRSTYQNTSGVVVSEEDILAYYVWIPRYKYRIPEVKCSTLTNPTYEEYPECYVYVLSDSDKTLLINWVHAYAQSAGFTSYTLEEATTDVNNALQTGTFSNASLGIEVTTSQLIDMYNQNNSDNQITYTTEFSSSNNYTGPREIDIIYEDKSTNKSLGDAVNTYYTHPAFTFGDMEVNGIWVGKFETGGTATAPLIKPNISSLRSQTVSAEFTTAQIFGTSTYGMTSNVDAHMMKNSEWGAVAYLSHSRYGVNREVYINNSTELYTGRSGGNVPGFTPINGTYTDQTLTTQYNKYGFYTWDGYLLEYNTNTKSGIHDINKVASTTGNITGVYDMAGGSVEYVMGNYNNTIGDSGFTTLPDRKYYDKYTTTNLRTACNGGICYGHGLSEVSNWYGDYFNLVNASDPWFLRGGDYGNGSSAGSFFFDNYGSGNADNGWAARSVLVVGRLQ